jgi:hypothetical protein
MFEDLKDFLKSRGEEEDHWLEVTKARSSKGRLAANFLQDLEEYVAALRESGRKDAADFDGILSSIQSEKRFDYKVLLEFAEALATKKPRRPLLCVAEMKWMVDEQDITSTLRSMCRADYAPEEASYSDLRKALWAICIYYQLPSEIACRAMCDALIDQAFIRIAHVVVAWYAALHSMGISRQRTKRSAITRREKESKNQSKALEIYGTIKREGKSLNLMAQLIHKRWGDSAPTVRTIYNYLTKAGKK